MKRRQALTLLGGLGLTGPLATLTPSGRASAADDLPEGVYFQNRGSVEGWDYSYAQKQGSISTIDTPTYKGCR
ncbi:hypothetical protein AB0H07_28075 [Streptomyces sp. NPDC021354]|uniref:hypothetical protein n=1 Tax=Streptomyces sp. NPDC021354 TaxID=3154793 RepID=UPI00340F59F5